MLRKPSPPDIAKRRLGRLREYKKAVASYKILKTCEFRLAEKDLKDVVESDIDLLTPMKEEDEEMVNLGFPLDLDKHRSSLGAKVKGSFRDRSPKRQISMK